MTYTYPYPMSAPGVGVVLYQIRDGAPHVLFSERKPATGKAGMWSLLGGHAEIIDILDKPVGHVDGMWQAAHREFLEEAPQSQALANQFPLARFAVGQPLGLPFVVRTDDANQTHTVSFVALTLTDDDVTQLTAPPASEESSHHAPGRMFPVRRDGAFDPLNPAANVMIDGLPDSQLAWPHEKLGLGWLLHLYETGRLWQ